MLCIEGNPGIVMESKGTDQVPLLVFWFQPDWILDSCQAMDDLIITAIPGYLIQPPIIFQVASFRDPDVLYPHRRNIPGLEFLIIVGAPEEFIAGACHRYGTLPDDPAIHT